MKKLNLILFLFPLLSIFPSMANANVKAFPNDSIKERKFRGGVFFTVNSPRFIFKPDKNNPYADDYIKRTINKINYKPGISIGLEFNFKISKIFKIQTELFYERIFFWTDTIIEITYPSHSPVWRYYTYAYDNADFCTGLHITFLKKKRFELASFIGAAIKYQHFFETEYSTNVYPSKFKIDFAYQRDLYNMDINAQFPILYFKLKQSSLYISPNFSKTLRPYNNYETIAHRYMTLKGITIGIEF